ncbi:MAG: effector-associated domain EAD1-containing protein [Anaerolineae bacterium]|nr:effector-associated domain EAD1-containing protein [Anaerolineae bacterium]
MRKLKPKRFNQLQMALLDAFSVDSLAILARSVDIRAEDLYAPSDTLPIRIERLLTWAESEDRVGAMIEKARAINPTNKQLAAVALAFDDTWYQSKTATLFDVFIEKLVGLRRSPILLIPLLLVILFVIWQIFTMLRGPEQMSGQFNVAVADFGILDASGNVRPDEFGAEMRSIVVNQLNFEHDDANLLRQLAGRLDVWHDGLPRSEKSVTLGTIEGSSAEERAASAEALAHEINANMVIYGYLQEADNPDSLVLEFYYDSAQIRGEPDAIAGSQRLGKPIQLQADIAVDPTLAKADAAFTLGQRSRLLAWLTTGLAQDAVGREEAALALFEEAAEQLPFLEPGNGREVLDYFIGREAFLLRDHDRALAALDRALDADPAYPNALLTKGSVFYDRAQLFFLRDSDIPAGLEQCVDLEQIDNGAPTLAAALDDIGQADQLFNDAIEAAANSVYPPLADTALLMRGVNNRLRAQALLFENNVQAAQLDLNSAETDITAALSAFAGSNHIQFQGIALAALGATYETMAYIDTVTGQTESDRTELALAQYDACIALGDDPAATTFLKGKIIDCACVPYRESLLARTDLSGGQ